VARALEFLGQASGAPVPRSVEAALTRWEARGTEAVLERTVLLRLVVALGEMGLLPNVIALEVASEG